MTTINLGLKLTADTNSAAAGVDRVRKSVDGLGEELVQTGNNGRRSAQEIGDGFSRTQKSVDSTSASLKGLQGLLATVFSAKAIIDLSDAAANLRSRLALVAGANGDVEGTMRAVQQAASDTRSDINSFGASYARLVQFTQGFSQGELLGVLETVTQAGKVSGASVTESNAAMIQFTQAMASGVLRGDELRSIMEQMPRLAKAIADGLGINVGQLREWGEEGKLSADLVLGAIQKSAGGIRDEFDQLQPTFDESFTAMTNSAQTLVGELNKIFPVLDLIKTGFINIAGGLNELTRARTVNENLAKAEADVQRLAASFENYGRKIKYVNDEIDKTQFDGVKQTFPEQAIFDRLIKAEEQLLAARKKSKAAFNNITSPVATDNTAIVDAQFRKSIKDSPTTSLDLQKKWQEQSVAIAQAANAKIATLGEAEAAQAVQLAQDRDERLLLLARTYQKKLADIANPGAGDRSSPRGGSRIDNSARDAAREEAKRQDDILQSALDGMRARVDVAKETGDLVGAAELESILKYRDQIIRANVVGNQDTIAAIASAIESDVNVAKTKMEELAQKQSDELQKLADEQALIDRSGSFTEGAKAAFKSYGEAAKENFNLAENAANSALQGMENALVDFVVSGKGSFRDFANSVLADIARIILRQQIAGIVGSFFGGGAASTTSSGGTNANGFGIVRQANGGAFTNQGLVPFAKGGAFTNSIVDTPTPFRFGNGGQFGGLMGEAGPEAILPLKRGSGGKLGVEANIGGQGINVVINNHVAGAQATPELSQGSDGKPMLTIIIEQVSGAIAGGIRRGDSPVASAIEGTYGANRAAGAF